MVGGGGGLRTIVKQKEKEPINMRRCWTAQRESTRFKVNLQGELKRTSASHVTRSDATSHSDPSASRTV